MTVVSKLRTRFLAVTILLGAGFTWGGDAHAQSVDVREFTPLPPVPTDAQIITDLLQTGWSGQSGSVQALLGDPTIQIPVETPIIVCCFMNSGCCPTRPADNEVRLLGLMPERMEFGSTAENTIASSSCLAGDPQACQALSTAQATTDPQSTRSENPNACPNHFDWEEKRADAFCEQSGNSRTMACQGQPSRINNFRTIQTESGEAEYVIDLRRIAIANKKTIEETSREFSDLLDEYFDAGCVKAYETYSSENASLARQLRNVGSSVGALYDLNSERICTGVISGGRILTALHCITRDDTIPVRLPRMEFHSLDGRIVELEGAAIITTPYYGDDPERPFDSAMKHEDIVAIVPDDFRDGGIEVQAHERGEPLLSLGYNRLLEWRNNALGTAFETEDALLSSIGVDASIHGFGVCMIFNTHDNGCLLHGCQTDQAMSGSPLLALRDGEFVVVGIQTGAVDHKKNDLCRPDVSEPHLLQLLENLRNVAADPMRLPTGKGVQ